MLHKNISISAQLLTQSRLISCDVRAWITAIADRLPIIQQQRNVPQNRFHLEGFIYTHTMQVTANALSMVEFFGNDYVSRVNTPGGVALDSYIKNILKDSVDEYTNNQIYKCFNSRIDGIPKSRLFVLAALLHDIGKNAVKKPTVINGEEKFIMINGQRYHDYKFPKHESIGRELFINEIANILHLTEKQTDYIANIIGSHKLLTDEVKQSRKRDDTANWLHILQPKIETVLNTFSQFEPNIKWEGILLYFADNSGKIGLSQYGALMYPDKYNCDITQVDIEAAFKVALQRAVQIP